MRFEDLFTDMVVCEPPRDPRAAGRLDDLLDQDPRAGEARGAVRILATEAEEMESRGVRVHTGS